MRLLSSSLSTPRPLLLKKPFSTLTNPNPNPKWLLLLTSRQISALSHLSQLLSLSIALGLFTSSHLPLLNSLLHSLARSRSPNLALSLLNSIRKQSITPDTYTLTSALKATSALSSLQKGRELHCLSAKIGLGTDTFVLNSLISMYSVCGEIGSARKAFDSAPGWALDVVSWNSMMSGYLKGSFYGEALWLFGEVVRRSVRMDGMTPVSALIACGRIGSHDLGRKIHALVVVNGFGLDFYLGSSLVSMYAKCGDLEVARKVFDGITDKNVVCWTSMISGYSKSGQFKEAVQLFRQMQLVGVKPDDATVACVASCCGQLGALDQGRYLHAYCDAKGIGGDLTVKNALIDMYSKCGDIERALQIFWGLTQRDVFSWTAMISGLAMNGHPREALELFSQMEMLGEALPNEVTFLGVLSACSHGGLVEEGFYYFGRMIGAYKLSPNIEHFGCIVDLLGRKKLLREMERFIREMPVEPDVVIWRSLIFACRAHGEVKLAEFAAKKMIELEPRKPGGHVLLSNVYAVVSRWGDVNRIRRGMNERSIHKEPGCSFIEINGSVHEFFSADSSHHQTKDIHQMLLEISRTMFQVCSM